MLDDLIARVEAGEISAEEAAQEAPLHQGNSVAVTIHLSGNVEDVVDFLEANGGSNISSGDDYIEAYVPVLKLAETSAQPGVIRVRVIQPPQAPQSQSQITGDGPGTHGSPAWNQAGYTGQGIKVGIIDLGFKGFSDLMGSELPATVHVRCYRSTSSFSQDLEDCTDWDDHGTRVAESVIDIAPDVSLYIAETYKLSQLEDAVEWMVSEGVSVINHSMHWEFDGPGDGTSPLSISPLNTVNTAVAAGIVWVNAAGNQAEGTWFKRGPFSYSTITVDGEERRVINFDGSDFRNSLQFRGPLVLRWEDSWDGASSNLDLHIVTPGTGVIERSSIDPQSGEAGHVPYESIIRSGRFDIMIEHVRGDEPDWIQLLGWGSATLEINTSGTGSITNPAESASPGMLAVGAANWDGVDTIARYSSRGPTPDERVKPDLVGADCGNTAAGTGISFNGRKPFCGTSQASPHIAGLAALVRQRFPDYTPAQVASYLKDNAQQRINSPDPNNTWGHGFIVLPPNPPQVFGSPSIDSVTAGVNALTIEWSAPSSDGGSAITAYDLRHIESDATDKADSNWTVVQDVWTGSGALSYELTELRAGTQYNVQARAVNATGDGTWSATATGTPTIAATPCATGGAVPNPHDNLELVADCDILLAVRDTLAGSETLNWATSTPIANWNGVEVSGTPQRVTLLYFDPRGLSGTIPKELGSLTGLTQLTIVDGQLSGPIPPELGSLTNLTGLHLFSNHLTGEIPAELARLTNLQDLSLYDNQLTGTIPSELANLTRLEALHIDTNRLSGSIPPELGSLTNLRWLTLHDNQLTGEIPSGLGRLTNLEQVWVAGNRFTGCVPAELRSVASTDRTHRLKEIGIPYCDVLLSGLSITASELRPGFDPYVTRYTAAATASSVTVSAASLHNATFQYLDQNDGVLADADGAQAGHQVDVPKGVVTTIRIKVTTSDGLESLTYEIEVTGLGGLSAPSIGQITSGVSSLTVSWREPSQTGGSAISAYDLRHIRSDAPSKADSNWTVVRDVWTGSGTLSYELTGLQGGIQYDIQVRAVNATGDGPWSATVAQTARGTVPGAPTSLAATAVGQTQIDLSWSAPQNIGGVAITGYRIEVSPDGSNWSDLVADSRSTTTSYSHTGLTASSTRHYRVSAINSEGTGPASNVANATTGAVPVPDLVVGMPTVDTSAPTAGARFTVSATVHNQGTGRSDSTTLRYYQSTDSTITTGDTAVGTDSVSSLNALRSENESVSLTAPSTPGTYYYGACVDAVNSESDTTNNCSSAVAVIVGAAPAPDLVVDTPTVSPINPTAGARFTLRTKVRNQGSARADSTTLWWYQSTDSTITAGDTVVGSDSVAFWSGIAVGASYSEDARPTAPSAPGTYYYGACVDAVSNESDTTNNCSSAVAVTVGAASAPDLVVDTPTVSNSSPTARAGITLNATVRNQGNGRSDSTTLRYYQSADSTITTGDTEVDTDYVSSLAASRSGNESVNLTAPTNPGTYYLGACVDAVSGESDTTNNCSAAVTVTVGAAPTPDLVVDAPTLSNGDPSVGARYTLDTRVRNQGNGRSDSTTLRYYESIDSTITTGDRELDTDYVSRLNPSESGDESVRLTAVNAGTYFLGACVDAVTNESDTTNNCSVAVAVTIGAAPTPDLVVDTPTVSNSAPAAGARITLSATVRNQGSGNANSTTLRYYQSTDSTITTSDTQVGTDSVSGLNASGSGNESISLTALSTAGTYYYGACVDAVTGESDTMNNCSAAVAVAIGAAPATAPGVPTGLSATANGQTQIDLSWTAPSSDGGASITGYKIEVSTDNSNWSDLVADTSSTATSYSHTELTAGSTRYYRVSAINSAGTGAASNVDSATTRARQVARGSPDLVVQNTNMRANLTPGYHWSPNATVRNQGDGPSDSTTLRYYRSVDSTITTGDTEVDTDPVEGLDPSASSREATGLNVPTTPGIYYYGACVDSVPGETDTTNNCSTATEVTVRIVNSPPQVVGDVDDLTVKLGEGFRVDISGVFRDPDGENVTNYGFTIRTSGILSGAVHTTTGILNLRAIGVGATVVAVNAADIHGNGSGAHDLFTVTVVPADTEATATTPGAPTDLTATADGQTEIDLSWTAPSDNGGAAITGYKIEASTDNSSWSILVADTSSTTTSYSHTGLTAGSTRYYRVSAINSAGTGTVSNVANATTPAAARTNSAPTAVGAIPEQVITYGVETTLNVSTYFSDTDGDDLSYSVDSPTLFNDLSVSGSTVTMRIDGPLCDPTTVTVTAQDPGGLEATQQFSVRRSNSPPVASSGTFPAQTIGVGESSGPLYMGNWFSDPDTCDSRLMYMAASSDTGKATATASGNIVIITGVSAGTATVTVTAQDTGGLEATLDIQVTVRGPAPTAPGAPTGLSATANGQTQIDLSWTAPSSDGGASITGYKIEVSTDNSIWSDLVANTGTTTTSYSHTNLMAGNTRYYRVSAINSVGTGPASSSDSATTDGEAISEGTCTVNLIVEPGESCTYPGTSAEFSVDSNGSGSFLIFSSGYKIEIRNSNINGVTYTFVASKQSSGNWLVEEVG